MASIIIEAENKKDLALLKELSEKMGLSSYFLDKEKKEDVNFVKIMNQNHTSEVLKVEEAKTYYQKLTKK